MVKNEFSPVKHKTTSSDGGILFDLYIDALEAAHALRWWSLLLGAWS